MKKKGNRGGIKTNLKSVGNPKGNNRKGHCVTLIKCRRTISKKIKPPVPLTLKQIKKIENKKNKWVCSKCGAIEKVEGTVCIVMCRCGTQMVKEDKSKNKEENLK